MKLAVVAVIALLVMSHPTGVRGLKYHERSQPWWTGKVAPHWGAWIEILPHTGQVTHWSGRTPLGCVD